jgi:dual specificity MAP kinase phosphatase
MNFSRITDDLFIGNTPTEEGYDTLRELGVRLVINMRLEKRLARDRHQTPLKFLWLPTADTPLLVIPLCCLRRGVRAALETIQAGGKVYVHCAKGRHRGVAMGASILIAQGYEPEQAMELIKARRPIADPDIFYIRNRILRFARKYQTIV